MVANTCQKSRSTIHLCCYSTIQRQPPTNATPHFRNHIQTLTSHYHLPLHAGVRLARPFGRRRTGPHTVTIFPLHPQKHLYDRQSLSSDCNTILPSTNSPQKEQAVTRSGSNSVGGDRGMPVTPAPFEQPLRDFQAHRRPGHHMPPPRPVILNFIFEDYSFTEFCL